MTLQVKNTRLRYPVCITVSAEELRAIDEAVGESGHGTRSEWLRAACELYAGHAIFRERRQDRITCASKKGADA